MGCCRRLPPGEGTRLKGILPERLILPLQVVALLVLAGTVFYAVVRFRQLTAIHIIILVLLMVIAAALSKECRVSRDFYRWLKDREKQEY